MTDPVLQSFYQMVSDPSWPVVENYRDFVHLPRWIQDECRDKHGLEDILANTCSQYYWDSVRVETTKTWKYQNIIFVPIHKCGYTYYNDLFGNRLAWQEHLLRKTDFDDNVVVACIVHPIYRYLKGITEWLSVMKQSQDIDLYSISSLIMTQYCTLADIHSTPYSLILPDSICAGKVHFVPADIMPDQTVRECLQEIFCQAGCTEIKLPKEDIRLNRSTQEELALFDSLKSKLPSTGPGVITLYQIFANDLKIYKESVNHWQKILT